MDSDRTLGYCWLSSTYGGLIWLQKCWWWPRSPGYVPAKIIQIVYAESIFYIHNYIVVCIAPGEHFHKETYFM